MVKIQFKALIFKSCFLLLLFVFIIFPTSKAQSLVDTNYARNIYDSAKVYYRNTNYIDAIKYFNKALIIKSKIPEDINPEYFKVYNWLGLVYRKQGNLQKAIEYYRHALENTNDGYYIQIINNNIANVYSLTGDYAKAIYYLENTLAVLERSNKERKYIDIVKIYNNQGYAYYCSGQMKLALEKSFKSIQIAEENQIPVGGETYYNCGLVYQDIDSTDKANFYFKKAVKSNEKEYGKEHYKTALAYMYYGSSFSDLGNYEAGLQLFKKSLKILLNNLGRKHYYTSFCLKYTGNLYYRTKNYRQALSYYQESLISKINNFNDSSIYANPSYNVFPDLDLLDVLKAKAQALEMLARRENRETNLEAALSTLELTVGFIEQLRTGYLYENSKLVLAEKEYETYISIIKIAYQLLNITGNRDYIKLAFKYAERGKYAVLRESINEESARHVASIPDSVQGHIQGIKEQIGITRLQLENENKLASPDGFKENELKEKLFRLMQSQEETIKELEQNYPEYYKRKYENKVVGIGELQQNLLDKEAVISYELTDSALYTFLVTTDTLAFTKTYVDTAFYRHLKLYGEFLHSEYEFGYVNYRIAAYELYKTLIKPIEKHLKGKNLLVIPDSKMSLLAFEPLITEPYREGEFADYASEPYLLLKYPVGYAYSATLYCNAVQKRTRWNPRFLGFAPDYKNSRDSLSSLPMAIKNVKSISRLIRGKTFTGEDATEYKLKKHAKNYGILHLYAHGNEDLENPRFSKMFMSYRNDSLEDGYLHAYEIDELNIDAGLVVLASCFSGSGSINKSEGALSIGRRFLTTGTPSLIVSLWLANYEASLSELKTFYWHLVLGKRKDEALRLAKLKYLKSTNPLNASPRCWSSLVVVGNQEALFRGFVFRKILLLLVISAIMVFLIRLKKRLTRKSNTNSSSKCLI